MPHPDMENKVQEVREMIAKHVRSTRAGKRLTQVEVARRAGVKQSRVSEIENAKSDPHFSTVSRITSALGLSITITQSAA